jgi:hypothetical protein
MSCRPRTTVNSKGWDREKLPDRLGGRSILIDPWEYIPGCLEPYARRYREMSVPIFNALLTLGDRHLFRTYKDFIRHGSGHEQKLMNWVSRAPGEVSRLPRVGHIKNIRANGRGLDHGDGSSSKHGLRTALYIMARSNRYVYIRDKSPLLSLVSLSRRIEIIFVGQGGESL